MKLYQALVFFFLPLLAFALPQETSTASPSGIGGQIGDIIGNLGSLGSVGDLLNPKTFERLETILRNAAVVLSDKNTKILTNLLKQAGNLLTPEFIDTVKGLIDDAASLLDAVSQLVSAIISSLVG